MNTNEAPEKIYIQSFNNIEENTLYFDAIWTEQPESGQENIEYTRTDTFIEKVQSFLNKKDDRDFYTIGYIKRHLEEIIKEVGL